MKLALPMKHRLLILLLTSFRMALAQSPTKVTNVLDSSIHQFIDQYSITPTAEELAGNYILSEGFWQESIYLKSNGRFRVTDTGGFSYLSVNRGSWKVKGNEILLTDGNRQETAYLLEYNERVCMLTSSTIQRWKEISAELQAVGGRLAYDPFMGKISLYQKAPAEDDP